ncbi:hypothetical protein [Lichenifustis flavocetrariae]|uniref:Uncharacterized protein n=1 Tax=Lichenifustis flavocetrariae TaxID=2949735 RepID=A0AA42CMY7_9HYPH|nr:hypothetical protein [Lichenifustis flavocetrariae]MCW6512993.1 hypothetical protein [Lichenifustis flavocetrariae]
MRRVIKPFTVEVRSGSRKFATPKPLAPQWPQADDQPFIAAWPETPLPRPDAPVPSEVTGRVLPVLNEAADSAVNEPKVQARSRPKRAPAIEAKAAEEAEVPAPPMSAEPTLLADVANWPSESSTDNSDKVQDQDEAAKADQPQLSADNNEMPVAVCDFDPPPGPGVGHLLPAVDTKVIAATLILRQGRVRLARADFARGERWKARLPIAVHQADKRLKKLQQP